MDRYQLEADMLSLGRSSCVAKFRLLSPIALHFTGPQLASGVCRYELEDDTVSWGMASQDDADLIPTDKLAGLRTDPLANLSGEFADPQRAKS